MSKDWIGYFWIVKLWWHQRLILPKVVESSLLQFYCGWFKLRFSLFYLRLLNRNNNFYRFITLLTNFIGRLGLNFGCLKLFAYFNAEICIYWLSNLSFLIRRFLRYYLFSFLFNIYSNEGGDTFYRLEFWIFLNCSRRHTFGQPRLGITTKFVSALGLLRGLFQCLF